MLYDDVTTAECISQFISSVFTLIIADKTGTAAMTPTLSAPTKAKQWTVNCGLLCFYTALILLRLWRYISHVLTYLLTIS